MSLAENKLKQNNAKEEMTNITIIICMYAFECQLFDCTGNILRIRSYSIDFFSQSPSMLTNGTNKQ